MIFHSYVSLPEAKSCLVGGLNPSEKYESVSWEDDIPNWMEKQNMFQTTNQVKVWVALQTPLPIVVS